MTAVDWAFVCQLTGAEMAARRQTIVEKLAPHIRRKEALADGYAFSFPSTAEMAQNLLAFILLELQCCPFFQIELVFNPENGAIWLRLHGG